MRGFFDLDSPFSKFGSLVADLLILSLLWTITSLPIITIGTGTTALFYVTTRRISDRESGIVRDYFKSFKREFVKSTIIWVIMLVIAFLVYFNISAKDFIFANISEGSILENIYTVLQLVVIIELLLFSVFVFPVLARFDLPLKNLLLNSLFMANKHFLTSIVCLILGAAIIYLTFFHIPLLAILGSGVYAFLASPLIIRVFRKYRPELDKDEITDGI